MASADLPDSLTALGLPPSMDGKDEADTCRICRGEGSSEEPLFHPCKCSGSIMFVHQDCLMEWLEHSQKKHCELCKTPFRFTKLYHPNMPRELPVRIFLQKAASHMLSNILWAGRGLLVALIWLFWLPWTMRFVWWGLFWLADVGWVRQDGSGSHDPSSSFGKEAGNTTFNGLPPVSSDPEYWQAPVFMRLTLAFYHLTVNGGWAPIAEPIVANQTQNATAGIKEPAMRHTLLSGVSFLNSLTPSQSFNRLVTDILEGQVITLVLVATIILILLIREWVVQQQPLINMAAEDDVAPPAPVLPTNGAAGPVDQAAAPNIPTDATDEPQARADEPGEHLHVHDHDTADEFDDLIDFMNARSYDAVPQALQEPRSQHTNAEIHPLHAHATIDAQLTEPRALQDLVSEVFASQGELAVFDPNDVGSPETIQDRARCKRIIVKTHETLLALQQASRVAFANDDHKTLLSLAERLHQYQAALSCLPERYASELEKFVQVLQIWLDSVTGPPNPDSNEVKVSMHSTDRTGLEDEQPHDIPTSTDLDKTQERPGMPVREASFVATVIQRQLQESAFRRRRSLDSPPASAISSILDLQVPLENGNQQEEAPVDVANLETGVGGSSHELSLAEHDDRRPESSLPPSPVSPRLPTERAPPRREFWSRPQSGIVSRSYGSARGLRRRTSTSETASAQDSLSGDERTNDHTAGVSPVRDEPSQASVQQTDDSSPEITSIRSSQTPHDRLERPAWTIRSPTDEDMEISSLSSAGREDDTAHNMDTTNASDNNASGPAESPRVAAQDLPDATGGVLAPITGWLWGEIGPTARAERHPSGDNDEHIVEDLADEAPFVPIANMQPANPQPDQDDQAVQIDPDAARAVAEAGINPQDPEAVEDVEEFEGVMELIGMQGPLTALATNGMFAAVFVSCAIALAVWFPFLAGKVALILLANPTHIFQVPFQLATGLINLSIDCSVFCIASLLRWGSAGILSIAGWQRLPSWLGFATRLSSLEMLARHASQQSSSRFVSSIKSAFEGTETAYSHTAFNSHASLRYLQACLSWALEWSAATTRTLRSQQLGAERDLSWYAKFVPQIAQEGLLSVAKAIRGHSESSRIVTTWSWSSQLAVSESNATLDFVTSDQIPVWTASDKVISIMTGYGFFAVLLAIYFWKIAPISTSHEGKKLEKIILEALQQSGGIAKVVLIISIEMLAFPLYCGVLLDIAMLPLFGHATIESRFQFTIGSPWKSLFVHWFIGTCYMFHFALFVAMCRRILRNGVLHFIRDPDDPTFHPVRDVLERSVLSQLRKIASSALIYGGLVIVCFGSVLWLLAYGMAGLLPIRWRSGTEPLGFPVELLLYTLLKPMLIRSLAPTEWLQTVYQWWFRKCAHSLGLSDYLFGEKSPDERRQYRLGEDDVKSHTRQTKGSWYRVPNNDQVRVRKRNKAWIKVNELNERLDGVEEPDDIPGVGPNDSNFIVVYVPPKFRIRVALFIACLWALTAGTGLSLTVFPLVCGRFVLTALVPSAFRPNDIYAFSVGFGVLSGLVYGVLKYRDILPVTKSFGLSARQAVRQISSASAATCARALDGFLRGVRCLYIYGVLTIVLPSLFALLIEFYLLVPLHTLLSTSSTPHTVHFLRSWTLGIQYVRIAIHVIQWDPESRPARAFQDITERGYSNPKPGLATRYFFIPATALGLTALFLPVSMAFVAGRFFCEADDTVGKLIVLRLAYPAVLGTVLAFFAVKWLIRAMQSWRMRIRDEVYLIGERLHNFGEQKPVRRPSLVTT